MLSLACSVGWFSNTTIQMALDIAGNSFNVFFVVLLVFSVKFPDFIMIPISANNHLHFIIAYLLFAELCADKHGRCIL